MECSETSLYNIKRLFCQILLCFQFLLAYIYIHTWEVLREMVFLGFVFLPKGYSYVILRATSSFHHVIFVVVMVPYRNELWRHLEYLYSDNVN